MTKRDAPPWDLGARRPDVALLVVLKEEFRELRRELSERWHARENTTHGGFDYLWIDPLGGYRCVATFSGRMSPEEAVHYTNRLLEWKPTTIVNIGIAAGLHSDLRIGDVVVPDLVVAYDKTSKVTPKDGAKDDWITEPRADAFRTSHHLVEKIKHLDVASPQAFSGWQTRCSAEFEMIREGNRLAVDRLLARTQQQVLRERPEVAVETLASGHVVAAAPAFAAWVRSINGDIKALEMETAGMLLAAGKRVNQVDTLVIRGISDHSAVVKAETEAIAAGALRSLAMRNAWRLFETLLELKWLSRPEELGRTDADPRLIELREQREQAIVSNKDTRALDTEILQRRRELRDSPNLDVEDILLDRYRLLERIGKGGFATAWKAMDRRTQRVVAIKALHVQWAEDRSLIERFRAGAEKVKALHHPAIVPILEGPHQQGHHHFFVMPYYSGGDLRRAVANGLPAPVALEAVARAIKGLAHAHERGLVHRDVKPDNLLIDERAKGCIGDFDLVRDEHSTAGTRTSAGMGSFVYAAPEALANAKDADGRADVYGAGMTILFALLRRDPPAMVAMTEPGIFDALPCDEQLRAAVRGAVVYDREQRKTTLAQLVEAIRGRSVSDDRGSWGQPTLGDLLLGHEVMPREAWMHAIGEDQYDRWATLRVGTVDQRMRWIKPGKFRMGSPDDEDGRFEREGPPHAVRLTKGFWMAETPCTQALWTAVMGSNPSEFEGSQRPVDHVSWDDVQKFLVRLGQPELKLPSEAQWEYACRAKTRTPTYAELDRIAWYRKTETAIVGQRQPNRWGLHDMLGNVWEWCADGHRSYSQDPVIDPFYVGSGRSRVFRGGSWDSDARYLRAAYRRWGARDHLGKIGFRLVWQSEGT